MMLSPSDRSLLTDQLRPPVGFDLLQAVGTTFTLDLISALSIPLAFGAGAVRESQDPIAILDGVRRFADRIDVFAQAGEVFVPPATDLVALTEAMIHPVAAPRGGLFHPKVWVLKYGRGGERRYRFLCSSRNLTTDRTWDAVLRLDSAVDGFAADNQPLREFVAQLPDQAVIPLDRNRRLAIERLATDLKDVRWELPPGASELIFHPLGGGRPFDRAVFAADRTVVISPFVSDGGIGITAPTSVAKVSIISRAESLDRLQPETLSRFDKMYVLDSGAQIEEEATPNQLVGLHAKVVVLDRGNSSRIFVGSANATTGAYANNVEFMVEFDGTRNGARDLLAVEGGFMNLLEEHLSAGGLDDDQQHKDDNALERAVRSVASTKFVATAIWDGPECDVTIDCDSAEPTPSGFEAMMRLVTAPGRSFRLPSGGATVGLGRFALEDLTPFLCIDVKDHRGEVRSCVVLAELRGDRTEERLEAVLARQINTPEKFLQLLMLLLAYGAPDLLLQMGQSAGAVNAGEWAEAFSGIFERLTRALADSPQAVDDLASVINGIRKRGNAAEVIPAGFDELWSIVEKAREALRA
jgi:hypothetical protein